MSLIVGLLVVCRFIVRRLSDRHKVLLLGPSTAAVSGVSTHVRQIMASSIAVEFDLEHFQVGSEGRRETGMAKLLRFLLSPILLVAVIVSHRTEIVHINTSLNFKAFWRDFVYLLIVKLLARKGIYQVHGGTLDVFLHSNRLRQIAVRMALSLGDVVVVLSEAERIRYSRLVVGSVISLIPNAIKVTEYCPAISRNERSRKMVLIYLGRLDRKKGLFEALHAMHILRIERNINNVRMQLAGSGPAESELKERIAELNLAECVSLIGPLFGRDKIQFLQNADMLVFPSYHEGLPYVILESMAAATPVLATPVGAIPEIIENGVHGVLVRPRDAVALADAIDTLIKDRRSLKRMSKACVERARVQYGMERLETQLKQLYWSVLA